MSEPNRTERSPISRVTTGSWSVLGEVRTAAALSAAGLDWTVIDLQHGFWDEAAMIQAVGLMERPAYVRVAAGDAWLIGRALDAGASGVIVPSVSDAAMAARIVAAAHYPPNGSRSWGPLHGGYDAGSTSGPGCFAMIETSAGAANAEAIAATRDLSGLVVGPFDLALALGTDVHSLLDDGTELARLADVARSAGIAAGVFAGTADRARRLRDLGYDWIASATEQDLISRGAAACLSALTIGPEGEA